MDKKNQLSRKRKLEKIAWTSFMTSYFGQHAIRLFTHTPSGLEQYLDNPTVHTTGKLLAICGLSYGLRSIVFFSEGYREEKLVTDGTHGVVRHPIYLGFRLGSLGMMVSNPSLENLMIGTAVLITSEITARMEDDKLLELYGNRFREYKSDVPGWIPYANHIKNRFKTVGKHIADIFRNQTSFE